MKKQLLIEALFATVLVWGLYGPAEVAAMWAFIALCVPVALITALLLNIYKKRRRQHE